MSDAFDIVERLRTRPAHTPHDQALLADAAAEITRLRAECATHKQAAELNASLANRYEDQRNEARAALSAQPAAVPGWQPIDAAPPANETLLLVVDGRVTTGDYFPPFGWNWDELDDEPEDARPTHWMPLPAAPQAPQQDEAQNVRGEPGHPAQEQR